MSKFKGMKFKVSDVAHSAAIQKALFALGYGWHKTEQNVQFADQPCLYADEYGYILYSDDDNGTFEHFYGADHVDEEEHFLSPAGFVAADYFKQPETAYCKGYNPGNCVGCGEAAAKPTLKPLAQHNHERMLDIISALHAKVERKEKLDSAWLSELSYLNEFMENN